VSKQLFLLFLSLFMRIYKHLKLLLFCEDIIKYAYFIAFYDKNNYKTKKQPYNLQTTIHGMKHVGDS